MLGQSDSRVLKLLSVDPSNYDDAPVEGDSNSFRRGNYLKSPNRLLNG